MSSDSDVYDDPAYDPPAPVNFGQNIPESSQHQENESSSSDESNYEDSLDFGRMGDESLLEVQKRIGEENQGLVREPAANKNRQNIPGSSKNSNGDNNDSEDSTVEDSFDIGKMGEKSLLEAQKYVGRKYNVKEPHQRKESTSEKNSEKNDGKTKSSDDDLDETYDLSNEPIGDRTLFEAQRDIARKNKNTVKAPRVARREEEVNEESSRGASTDIDNLDQPFGENSIKEGQKYAAERNKHLVKPPHVRQPQQINPDIMGPPKDDNSNSTSSSNASTSTSNIQEPSMYVGHSTPVKSKLPSRNISIGLTPILKEHSLPKRNNMNIIRID